MNRAYLQIGREKPEYDERHKKPRDEPPPRRWQLAVRKQKQQEWHECEGDHPDIDQPANPIRCEQWHRARVDRVLDVSQGQCLNLTRQPDTAENPADRVPWSPIGYQRTDGRIRETAEGYC